MSIFPIHPQGPSNRERGGGGQGYHARSEQLEYAEERAAPERLEHDGELGVEEGDDGGEEAAGDGEERVEEGDEAVCGVRSCQDGCAAQ